MIAYRKSWFDEVGATKFPDDLGGVSRGRQEAQGQGAAARPDARPYLRRRPTFTYPYIWSWGGKEVEADGKTVNLNNKDVIESVKFMTAFWKDAHRRGRARLGRLQQQPRLPVGHDLRHAERRLDLHRVAARARTSTRPTRVRSSRPTSCTRRCRKARRASSRCTPTTRTACRAIRRTRRPPRTS